MKTTSVDLSRSAVARYLQLATLFRRRIEQGTWRRDERIPTVDELAAECGVARATIRQALDQLEQDGLIARYRAKGTFVRATPAANRLWCEVETDWSGLLRSREGAEIEILGEHPGQPADGKDDHEQGGGNRAAPPDHGCLPESARTKSAPACAGSIPVARESSPEAGSAPAAGLPGRRWKYRWPPAGSPCAWEPASWRRGLRGSLPPALGWSVPTVRGWGRSPAWAMTRCRSCCNGGCCGRCCGPSRRATA